MDVNVPLQAAVISLITSVTSFNNDEVHLGLRLVYLGHLHFQSAVTSTQQKGHTKTKTKILYSPQVQNHSVWKNKQRRLVSTLEPTDGLQVRYKIMELFV